MKKIKVGIWGLGRAGRNMHTNELLNHHAAKFEIAAAYDCDPEVAEKFGKDFNCKYYTTEAEFLADKEVELVSIATFSPDHVGNAKSALEAGYFVFLEKPLAISMEQADQLAELNKKYPGKIFCRQNRRYEAAFQHVKEILASGILGKVHTIKLSRNNYTRRNDWQTLKANGGGLLNNWGPHLIDHALQFLDYKVKDVWSELKHLCAMGDAEDAFKVIMRNYDGLTVDIEVMGGCAFTGNAYEIYGDRGALMIDSGEKDIKLNYIEPDYELKPYPVIEGHPDGFKFSDNAKLPWRRKTIMVEPSLKCNVCSIYGFIYDTIREGKEFPIKFEEAYEVLKYTALIKEQNPQFK